MFNKKHHDSHYYFTRTWFVNLNKTKLYIDHVCYETILSYLSKQTDINTLTTSKKILLYVHH